MTDQSDEWGDLPAPGEGDDGFDVFDAGGVDTSRLGNVRYVDKAGFYHFAIEATPRPHNCEIVNGEKDYNKPRKPDILCTCRVLAAAHGLSPEGSVLYHNITLGGKGPGTSITDNDKRQTVEFLFGLGILEKRGDKIIDPQTGTEKINPNTLADRINAVKQFVGQVKHRAAQPMKDTAGNDIPGKFYDERYEFSWGRGAFKLDDPAVWDIPKNAAALQAIGKEHLLTGKVPPPPVDKSADAGKAKEAPKSEPKKPVMDID